MPVYFVAILLSIAGAPIDADVVISNATIHDGAGNPSIHGDLAIKGSRIVAIGKFEVSADATVIDASGLIVAPGFIDLHNHSDRPITQAETRLNKNYITQGVTTIVTGNCGGGRADVGVYLDQIDKNGAGTNVAHLIPQGAVRREVIGSEKRPATPAELAQMKTLFDQAMQSGAWGMSTGLIYVPSKYADTTELVELAKVVGKHNGIYVSHMRNENTRLLESIDETLAIGEQASLPVHISHFKASGRAAWGLAADAVHKVQAARDAGRQVTADQYPYIASSTSLGAMVVPDEYRTTIKFTAALKDERDGANLRQKIERSIETRSGGASLFVASYSENRGWQGRDLASLAKEQDRSVLDLVIEIQSNGGAAMVNFGMQEEEVRLIMQQPFVAVASDGGAKVPNDTVPHPRNYGTFPRRIGHYAIERGIVTLEQAIRSATGLPADILGMKERGYLKPGNVADLVVFDPKAFRDTATFQQPHQYATGVRYLFVNGQLVIDQGEVTGKLAGRALRHKP
ncbi:MAG: N-acyl-D-amino acid deacylase [Planctomycetaceae bacterium]|nr:N-acyl-D-amino acid deacylase [Planctomycetaceae bacterium]